MGLDVCNLFGYNKLLMNCELHLLWVCYVPWLAVDLYYFTHINPFCRWRTEAKPGFHYLPKANQEVELKSRARDSAFHVV